MGPPEEFGPTVPAAVQNDYGPEPIQYRSLVLVFGPGLARAYACAGVLRALNNAKIHVAAVVGTEMGGLIGALYGESDSMNKFEWSLTKFKTASLTKKGGLFAAFKKGPSDGSALQDALDDVLEDRKIQDAKIPFKVVLQYDGSDDTTLADQGDAASALRGALALPDMIVPGSWQGRRVVAASSARPFAISEAKLLGLGPVVAVDVLSDDTSVPTTSDEEKKFAQQFATADSRAESDLKDADLVIRPDLRGIGYFDFQKKTEIAFRGKSAALAQMPALRNLAGLPPETESGVAP